ncbi:MAG: polysaccharide deacetylase family protein [Gemmatimonadaceae bacterium]
MYRPLAVALAAMVVVSSASVIACNSSDTRSAQNSASAKPASTGTASNTPDTAIPVAEAATTAPGSAVKLASNPDAAQPEGSGAGPQLPSNKMGRIPVLEYHVIGDKDGLYSRTREHYRADLEYAYQRGYRPVTLAQVLDKDFSDVPVGMSPVVVVFDDASPNQFSYIERNGKLEIDPTSAMGIWLDFAKTHPGWKNRAVFCMLNGGAAGHNFFGDNPKFQGQKNAWRFIKVKWLADNGFELCDHTVWHAMLNKYSDTVVQEQIARNAMGIDSAVPGYKIRSMALPYGIWPKNRQLAWQGSWRDPKTGKVHSYHFEAVMEVAGGPTRSPYDPAFDPHKITRIQAVGTDIEKTLDNLDKTKTRFVR